MPVLPWPGKTIRDRHSSESASNVPDTRPSLERIRQLDLRFQHLNAPRCLAGGQIPRILRGLIRLFAQPFQPEALRPRHLLGEESFGVVFALNLHIASPL